MRLMRTSWPTPAVRAPRRSNGIQLARPERGLRMQEGRHHLVFQRRPHGASSCSTTILSAVVIDAYRARGRASRAKGSPRR